MLIINVLINEEVVSATPEVSGSCEGGIPGHTVGVRQGIFPLLGSREQVRRRPACAGQGSAQGAASGDAQRGVPDSPEPSSPGQAAILRCAF